MKRFTLALALVLVALCARDTQAQQQASGAGGGGFLCEACGLLPLPGGGYEPQGCVGFYGRNDGGGLECEDEITPEYAYCQSSEDCPIDAPLAALDGTAAKGAKSFVSALGEGRSVELNCKGRIVARLYDATVAAALKQESRKIAI